MAPFFLYFYTINKTNRYEKIGFVHIDIIHSVVYNAVMWWRFRRIDNNNSR